MSADTATVAPDGTPEVQAGGLFTKLSAIFFEPRKAFEEINRKPTWLGIFLVLALVVIAGQYVAVTRVDYETYLRQALAMNPFTKGMSDERIQQMRVAAPKYGSAVYAGGSGARQSPDRLSGSGRSVSARVRFDGSIPQVQESRWP